MINKTYIKDFYGRVLGTIEEDAFNGKFTIKDFFGRVKGTYDPKADITKDFYGKVVARGNALTMLLPSFDDQRKN